MGSATVLLVEDEQLISDMIAEVLSEGGFIVHAVGNARDALRYLDSASPVDVLFTDINLPGDMDGSALAVRARELRPDLPILYASGRYDAASMLPLVTRSLFVAKPYDPQDMCTLLGRLAHTAH